MTFYEWLSKHTKRNSPLGDLARDVQSDHAGPSIEDTKEAWRTHLRTMNACSGAMKALDAAWVSFRRAVKHK